MPREFLPEYWPLSYDEHGRTTGARTHEFLKHIDAALFLGDGVIRDLSNRYELDKEDHRKARLNCVIKAGTDLYYKFWYFIRAVCKT